MAAPSGPKPTRRRTRADLSLHDPLTMSHPISLRHTWRHAWYLRGRDEVAEQPSSGVEFALRIVGALKSPRVVGPPRKGLYTLSPSGTLLSDFHSDFPPSSASSYGTPRETALTSACGGFPSVQGSLLGAPD